MIRQSSFYALFFVILLLTEFFYLEIGGGVARIYHFLAVVVVLFLINSVHYLFRSGIFLALLVFSGVNVAAAFFSDNQLQAYASLMSFFANVAIAMAVALILLRNKLSLERLTDIILGVTMISVFWGLVQVIAFKAGAVLALSPQQESQILSGFGPGFRTEANTFAKYLLLPFLLFLPVYLKNPRNRKYRLAYGVIIIGILMNFTRSALFGLVAALLFAFFWYMVRGQLFRISIFAVRIAMVVTLGIALIMGGVVQFSDYAKYKMDNFFNKKEILEGGSSAYRLMAMEAVIENTLSNSKRIIIGNGWGQTYVVIQDQRVQAGGADIVNILGSGGILGIVFYLFYSLKAFVAVARVAKRSSNSKQIMFAEGLLFAFVGMFVTGQMSGYLITPEYWLLIGLCIYVSIVGKTRYRTMKLV